MEEDVQTAQMAEKDAKGLLATVTAEKHARIQELNALLGEKEAEYQAALREKSKDIKMLMDRVEPLEKELAASITENDRLTVLVKLKSDKIHDLEEEIERLKRQIADDEVAAAGRGDEWQALLKKERDEKAVLRKDISELTERIREVEREEMELHRSLEAAEEAKEGLQSRINGANDEIQRLKDQVSKVGCILAKLTH